MRTFSEEEARDVFARAAREQQAAHEAADSGAGLTLDELQEIGRASGLDPAFVAAAAAGLGAPAVSHAPATWLGMPVEVKRTRLLPGPLSDEAWEQTVEALRAQFGGPGITSQFGRVREWASPSRSGLATEHSVYVSVRPTASGGTEVTVEQRGMKENVGAVPGFAGTFGAFGLLLGALFLFGSFERGVLILPALLLAAALLSSVVGVPAMRAWARRLDARFEAALDRIDLLARADTPTAVPEPLPDLGDDATARLAAPRLDLDALGAEPDGATGRSEPTRTRTRE